METVKDADILRALEELCARDNDREGFYRTEEMKRLTGLTAETIRERLHVAAARGRLETRKFREPGLGGQRLFTGYRILPEG